MPETRADPVDYAFPHTWSDASISSSLSASTLIDGGNQFDYHVTVNGGYLGPSGHGAGQLLALGGMLGTDTLAWILTLEEMAAEDEGDSDTLILGGEEDELGSSLELHQLRETFHINSLEESSRGIYCELNAPASNQSDFGSIVNHGQSIHSLASLICEANSLRKRKRPSLVCQGEEIPVSIKALLDSINISEMIRVIQPRLNTTIEFFRNPYSSETGGYFETTSSDGEGYLVKTRKTLLASSTISHQPPRDWTGIVDGYERTEGKITTKTVKKIYVKKPSSITTTETAAANVPS